jgi:glycosyltransferase involved in cell wall biosynthesis
MKILHLLSDWKWTGPSEPVVSLCEALGSQGTDVTLAYRKAPADFAERTVEKEAGKRGIKGHGDFKLTRYFSLRDWFFDINAIRHYVRGRGIDIVHTNLSHDHVTAVVSLLFGRKSPLVVRTDHKRDGLERGPGMAAALRRTDGLVTYSERIRKHDIEVFRFPFERSCVLPPGVRLFTGTTHDLRSELGIGPREKVAGVIGRLKPDRGYDVVLKALKILRSRVDGVKLVIVGRSSQVEESIRKPVASLGLEDDVILAGYRLDDYFSMIGTFDIFIMMRAGSDGTARALREVLSMGKPALVSDLGMLPELVEDGETGYVVRNEVELADRMERLLTDEGLRKHLGEAARKRAVEQWDYAVQAQKLIAFYDKMLSMGKRKA